MIRLVRVDHRLLHGQVALSWVNGVGADCILVANDFVSEDPVWKTTLKLGKPSGCKLVIKSIDDSIAAINSGVTDRYRLIVVLQTVMDAKRLVEGCPAIKSINLGNTKKSPTTMQVSRQVFLEPEEIEVVRWLVDRGIECEIRPLADDEKIDISKRI